MSVQKIVVAVAGGVLIVLGIALLVLPGPGLLLIALGLFVLSFEFDWARRLVESLRSWLRRRRPSTGKRQKEDRP